MATANAGLRSMPTRPYKDFLTPSMHRRFTNAAFVGFFVCWIEATIMSKPSLFWSWFPLSWTGLRMLLLFVSCLTIFILRISQLHIGRTTAASAYESSLRLALTRRILITLLWYGVSAFLFSETYIFSSGKAANLSWVDSGRSYERSRLNERPVFFRSLFFCLTIAQAAAHIFRDYDALIIGKAPAKAPVPNKQATIQPSRTSLSTYLPLAQIQDVLVVTLERALTMSISTALVGPLVYFVLLRNPAWTLAHGVGKTLFSVSKSTQPPGLTDVITLIMRFSVSSFLLVALWEISNQAFTNFVSEEPLKKGVPLTSGAKDPNGSLIQGLKSKKQIPKSMAFWELAIITERLEDRRRTLYQEVDRQGGSTWSQVSQLCLAEIQSVTKAIQSFSQPPSAASAQAAPATSQPTQTLPRISQPLRQDNIVNAAPSRANGALEAVANGVGSVVKSIGQSPGADPVTPRAQKAIAYGTDHILSKEQQQKLGLSNLSQQANQYAIIVLRSPVGWPFRQTFAQRLRVMVFGTPYSNAINVVHATQALCRLTVWSLREDSMGQVQKDIGTIIKVLMSTIQNVQSTAQSVAPHWTDVEFKGDRKVKEVDELLDVMRKGLEDILMSFGEYADALGLSRMEMRQAKQIARTGPEMEVAEKR